MPRPNLPWPARVAIVAVAAATVAGLSGGVATADATSGSEPTVTTYEVFREVVKPWDSITIPSRQCPTGFLHNHDYSPGRIVPRGVEVVEPGGVGVTITHSDGPVWVENGRLVQPITGFDADHSYSGATNWDPFTSREIVITLHCTLDTDHAVVEDLGPSPI
ncbi:MAG TPA: hypothetical protein VFT68_04980 [Lapillicoccus sp.]|nr:hypothetical protein [Lapillicoccus sp.]